MNDELSLWLGQLIKIHGTRTLVTGVFSSFVAGLFIFGAWWLLAKFERLRRAAGGVFSRTRALDRWLVRNGSYVVGTRYSGWLRRCWFACFALLVIAGVLAPSGAVTAFSLAIGLIFILIILRHWAHDEEERLKDLDDSAKLVNTSDDLRIEAASSVVLLFAIAPMGFSRLDDFYPGTFSNPTGLESFAFGKSVIQYVGFAWSELPHSIPIVHGLSAFFENNPFDDPTRTRVLQSATSVLRIAYELFVVGAIVDLVRIGRRIANLEDMRPLKKLLASNSSTDQRKAVRKLGELASYGSEAALKALVEVIKSTTKDGRGQYDEDIRLYAEAALANATDELGSFIRWLSSNHDYYRAIAGISQRDRSE